MELVWWLCPPCGWQTCVRAGDLPQVCPYCKRAPEAVPDNDGVDILES